MNLKHCLLTDLLDECQLMQDLSIKCRDGKFVCNSFLFASVFPGLGKLLESPNVEEENLVIFILDIDVQDLRLLFDNIYNRKNITLEQNTNIHFLLKWSDETVNSTFENIKADLKEIIKWEAFNENDEGNDRFENFEHDEKDKPVLIPLIKKKAQHEVESQNSDGNWEVEEDRDEEDNDYNVSKAVGEYRGGKRVGKYKRRKMDLKYKSKPPLRFDYKELACDVCEKTYPTEECLYKHLAYKHGPHPQMPCPDCEDIFSDPRILLIHRKEFHREKRTCPECGKQFIKERFEAHLQSHVDQKIPCEQCDKVFKSPINLKNHIRYVHEGVKRKTNKYPSKMLAALCDLECKCGIPFKQAKDKVSHYQIVHLGYQHCPKCNKIVKSLDQHKCEPKKKRQASKNVKRVVCQECGKECSVNNLYYHMKKYHDTEECSCHKCGKKYRDRMSLRDHLRDCMKSEQCNLCGIMVLRMKDHIRSVHTAEEDKRFVCNLCGKGFYEQRKLENHKMNVHLKLRPHRCRYGCDIGYNDTSNRNAHEKKKHGGLFSDARKGLPID